MMYDLVGHDVSIPMDWIPVARNIGALAARDVALPLLKNALFMTGAESNPALSRIVGDAGIPGGIKLVATLNDYVGDMSKAVSTLLSAGL